MVQHNEPKRASVHWSPAGEVHANMHEILFWSLLLVRNAERVGELDKWAREVHSEYKAATEQTVSWKPPEHFGTYKCVSAIYKPMIDAMGVSWRQSDLAAIGTAMRAATWHPGQHDELDWQRLRDHVNSKTILGVKPPSSKRAGPPRWRTWSIVLVAETIRRHRKTLGDLLGLDVEMENVPIAAEVIAKRDATIAELQEKLRLEMDKLRKAAERNKTALTRKTTAVRSEREKTREKIAKALEKEKERLEKKAELVRSGLEAEYADDFASALAKVAKARARARKVESEAKASRQRLQRAQKAEAEIKELRLQVDELMEVEVEAEEKPDSPTTDIGRRDERGRFVALDWKLRELILAEEARRTPPTAIAANITDVLRVFASDKVVPLPCTKEMMKMRNELTIVGECLAAFRVALAKRIVSFGFDESTKFGLGLLSSNTQIEEADGVMTDVIMRGATLTAGSTSEQVAKSVEEKIFCHARRLLAGWKAQHEKLFGPGTWSGPDPSQIGLHRLAEETVIMGDTCNGERKAKRLVAEAAEAAKRLEIGDAVWEAMSEDERETACKSYIGDCHDHLRNIVVNAMATAATDMLKDALEDDLAEFSSFDRMSVDGMDLIRGAYKELHPGGEYAKGKGRESKVWVEKVYPSSMWVPIYNSKGSRQDAVFDGSLSLFANWNINLDFLHGLVKVPRADNKLELFLWRCHRCNDLRALARVNTLWKLVITDAMRWLSGKANELKDWSLVSADRVLELAEAAFVAIAADGRKLLDPTFDPFTEIADSQPAFKAWREARAEETVTSADGTKHRVYERVGAEARTATLKGNVQATARTVALAERMANAALVAMYDTKRAIREKLTSQDGACAPGKRQKMHKATIGAHVNNSRCESMFSSYDYVGHIFRGASSAILGGLGQQMRNRDFERPPLINHNPRKRSAAGADAQPAADGFYHRLPSERLKQSLLEYARLEAVEARKAEREDVKAHDGAKLARREERVIELLNLAVKDYAYSKELFMSWQSQAAKSDTEVSAFLAGKPESQQLEYLRKQIEMRTIGLGWTQFTTRWSSNKDAKIGTVAHLRELLKEILTFEITARRMKELPTEAALPQQIKRDLGQLGALDEDAMEIEKKALFSTDELKAKADAEMQRRVEAGIADTVEALNGNVPPAFDQQLVGKQLEVCWKYTNKDTKEPMLIWATGRVVRVADGLTDKRSPRARMVLPAGMVLWAWDADPDFGEAAGEQWLALVPQKWNPSRALLYGWRYDPREFAAARATE